MDDIWQSRGNIEFTEQMLCKKKKIADRTLLKEAEIHSVRLCEVPPTVNSRI